MNIKAKVAALLVGVAAIISTVGCGASTAMAGTVDGVEIAAGEYILAQFSALSAAQTQFSTEYPDVDTEADKFSYNDYTLDGIAFRDWVANNTADNLKKQIAYQREFESLGLSFTEDEQKETRAYVNSLWTEEDGYMMYYGLEENIWGEYYEKYGIGKQSFLNNYTRQQMQEEVFHAYYDVGGTQEVSKDELLGKLADENVKLRVIVINQEDVNSEGLTPDEVAQRKELADKFVADLNGGKAFAEVDAEYEAFLAEEDRRLNPEDYEDLEEEETEESTEPKAETDFDEYFTKTSTKYPEAVINRAFEMQADSSEVIEAEEAFYVVQKLDLLADEEWVESNKESALHTLKGDELDGIITAKAQALSIDLNQSAVKRYKYEKLMD